MASDPGNAAKLELYALFKQATEGACTGSEPGMFSPVKRAKWQAWNALGDMSAEDARAKYVARARELGAPVDGGEAAPAPTEEPPAPGTYTTLNARLEEDGVYVLEMNRPKKMNAISFEMYDEIVAALEEAGKDERARVVLWTGAGAAFSAGNDLSNFTRGDISNLDAFAEQGAVVLEKFVNAFIDCPKPLVAGVNGPAIGIATTLLGLCDIVYASSASTYHTPFSQLGQSAEACSSLTFPEIMGPAKANEVLLFGRKLTADEFADRGMVTEVIEASAFRDTVRSRASSLAALPPGSLQATKGLVRGRRAAELRAVNAEECRVLKGRWTSPECMDAVMGFLSKSA